MGQSAILKVLETNPETWFSAKELSEMTEVNVLSARRSLKILEKSNFIKKKKIKIERVRKTVIRMCVFKANESDKR